MEKEHQPDSMATVTMKPDYAPSEVYSTSEPPPAYRQRPSNSVQIARIAALTVVAASFILGAFILASSWISARASCHQLEQLDAMLDKELALEGRSYGNDGLVSDEPLPVANAHALHGAPPQTSVQPPPPPTENIPASPAVGSLMKDDALNHAESKINEDKLQNVDDSKDDASSDSSEDSSESDSSAEDDDELDARPIFKLPINFDLDELAGAFLANNQKGRMNCVVERRREDPLERRFPFNLLKTFSNNAPQAERIAIICHGGDEPRPSFPDPASQIFDLPLGRPMRPLFQIRPKLDRPLSPLEARMPPMDSRMPSLESRMPSLESRMPSLESRMPPMESRMPSLESRMPPFGNMPQQRASSFPLPLPWDSSEENVNGPREMRIHVQRVFAIPAPHNMPPPPESMGPFPPPPPPQNQEQTEQQNVIHQFVPQPAPTQELEQPDGQKPQMENAPVPMGLPWGLTPEDLHMIHRTAEEAVANHQRDQQIDNDMQEMKNFMETLASNIDNEGGASEPQQLQAQEQPRTLLVPQEVPAEERPHYVQPRSVRSVDSLLHREKRVKRCSCDCA